MFTDCENVSKDSRFQIDFDVACFEVQLDVTISGIDYIVLMQREKAQMGRRPWKSQEMDRNMMSRDGNGSVIKMYCLLAL